jgi:nucleoid-associated protein
MRLIAHQIVKAQHSDDVSKVFRNELLTANDDLKGELMRHLRGALTKRNPIAARFKSPAGAQPPLQQRLLRYLGEAGDQEFIQFSKEAVDYLATKMGEEPLATGGFVVFAEHDYGDEVFLLIALLSMNARPSFDGDLNLVSTTSLDFEHLRHASRIRESQVQTNEDGVVHFISKKGGTTSDYFLEFLGCAPVTDSSAQGNRLYTVLRQWAENQQMTPTQKEAMFDRTYGYWRDCRSNGQPMTMSTLATVLSPDDQDAQQEILDHLSDEASGLAGEFSAPAPNVMRHFVRFAFKEGGFKFEFDRERWLDKIQIRNNTVTIQNAPADLIKMISEEKNGT